MWSTTGLLREFVRKYPGTKDLEAKIRETKELRADFQARAAWRFELDDTASALAIMKRVRIEAQGQMSQEGCGFFR